ncbi:MAG: FtsQ-type POTRA domain-containing protein [Candidatus Aminicenantes bacterium]|nr:FtsQ-type POTRA domain-containing protein [Candidatus Aminicenantes bacterium]TFG58465.1 MAG: FtsQ-type POTRA domain-containing protein [Candidatus Aminicenantes bacterium]
MATVIGELGREKSRPLFARRPFLRPGERDIPLQKNRRRRALRLKHVLFLLGLQAGFFLAVRSAYLFLITWDQLAIRKVAVVCAKDNLRRTLENHFAVPRLGNILLCDLQALRGDIRRLAWVKDVSIQKVFPSELRITVVERTPFAILERDGLCLADKEGRVLEKVYSLEEYHLPVISDESGFASNFFEKWRAAGDCLETLPRAERDRLAGLRCGNYGSFELLFKDDPIRVVVDPGSPAESLALFRRRRPEWERLFGPLASVNMRYDGRVYLKAAEPAGDAPVPDKGD